MFFSRFLHAVAGAGHPPGALAGADPLGVALDVRSFRAPRSPGLGGAAGRAGQERTHGDRSAPRCKLFFLKGNAIFVTTQSPKRRIDAGKFDLRMPTEGPALKTERKIQNPASSEPQERPFLGGRFGSPCCTFHAVRVSSRDGHIGRGDLAEHNNKYRRSR